MKLNIKKRSALDFRPYPFVDYVVKESYWHKIKHRLPLFIFAVMCFFIGFITRGFV